MPRACIDQHRRLTPSLLKKLQTGLGNLASLVGSRFQGGKVRVGTACSGTEVLVYFLTVFLRFWSVSYGLEIGVEHCFACEAVPHKRLFIDDHFSPKLIFTDVTTLHTGFATCGKSGKTGVEIPQVDFFAAGFECDQFSALNNDRSDTPGCLTRGDGKSGSTGRWGHPILGSVSAAPLHFGKRSELEPDRVGRIEKGSQLSRVCPLHRDALRYNVRVPTKQGEDLCHGILDWHGCDLPGC